MSLQPTECPSCKTLTDRPYFFFTMITKQRMKTPDFYFEAINDPSRLTNPPKSMTNKSAMQQRLAGENTWLVEKRARIFGWGPREIKKYLSSITDEVVRRIVEDNLHVIHNRRTKSKKTLMSRVFGSNNPYKRMSKSK